MFGKARLAPALDTDARLALMQRMAEAVINAAGDRPTIVVTSAPEVVEWCAARGIATIDDPGSLDDAAAAGQAWAAQLGLARVVIAHADLPHASSLDNVATAGPARVAVLVPDRHDDGTPVISIPVDADFRFAYGPGSFARHVEAARAAQLEVVVVRDRALGFDVDVAADLADMDTSSACPALTCRFRTVCSPSGRTPTTSSSAAAPRSPSGPTRVRKCTSVSAPTARRARGTPTPTSPRSSPCAKPNSAMRPRRWVPPTSTSSVRSTVS